MANNKKYEWALPIGTTINGGQYPYEVVDVLGHGGFGITYKVKARVTLNNIKVDVFFALKEYFPTGCEAVTVRQWNTRHHLPKTLKRGSRTLSLKATDCRKFVM